MEKVKRFKFRKINRIKSKKGFQLVYTSGRSVVDTLSVIYVLASPTEEVKIGLAVGKKLGNAVLRNRVKRMMREAFRMRINEIKPNTNIVWVARKKLIAADYKTYDRVLMRLVKRAGLMN